MSRVSRTPSAAAINVDDLPRETAMDAAAVREELLANFRNDDGTTPTWQAYVTHCADRVRDISKRHASISNAANLLSGAGITVDPKSYGTAQERLMTERGMVQHTAMSELIGRWNEAKNSGSPPNVMMSEQLDIIAFINHVKLFG